MPQEYHMDSQAIFCPNSDCPARGQVGQGNIIGHGRTKRRFRCKVCGKTFTPSKGTVFYRLRHEATLVVLILTLLAYGCPVQAIVVAFGLDERTVSAWWVRAGHHCEKVHEQLVHQPRDLGQVQADEIRVKKQGGVLWLAMALQVSTRLWLGAVVGEHRDEALLTQLMQRVRAGALCRPLLFCIDGWRAYLPAIQTVFRERLERRGRPGRPILRPWDGIVIGQMIKQYAQGHVVGVVRRIAEGTPEQATALLQQTQGGGVINTAYIERLNGTFRARLHGLVRRGRSLLRQAETLTRGVYVVGTIYNFCTAHDSLRLEGLLGGHKWLARTPAMAAGITDHCWTVQELMLHRVPPSRWIPPKRRGRPSQARKQLIARWCR
jgi:transposase-like protein